MLEEFISSTFFGGALGALVSLRYSGQLQSSWLQRAMTLLCGALLARYLAQPAADWLKLAKESDVLGIAFVLGLLGLSVVAAAFRALGELKVAEIVTGWISRGGGGGGGNGGNKG